MEGPNNKNRYWPQLKDRKEKSIAVSNRRTINYKIIEKIYPDSLNNTWIFVIWIIASEWSFHFSVIFVGINCVSIYNFACWWFSVVINDIHVHSRFKKIFANFKVTLMCAQLDVMLFDQIHPQTFWYHCFPNNVIIFTLLLISDDNLI